MQAAPIPPILYGTAWKEERTQALTAQALAAGVVGLDTANQRKHYFEAAVGQAVEQAIADGGSSRGALFLQTKYTFRGGQDHRLPYDAKAPIATQVKQSFESSLEHLATDYLDSYLLHGPMTQSGLTPADVEAWRAMESLAQTGATRFIGVSNVSASQLEALWQLAQVKPRFVQNRCYGSAGWDRSVRDVCRARDIIYQGFSLLTANRRELTSPAMKALAARKQCSPAELVFAFARNIGMLPLTGTSSAQHLEADLRALELELDRDELRMIEEVSA